MLTCCLTKFATSRIVRREQHNVTRQISMTTRKELLEALLVAACCASGSKTVLIC
jgi:BMFP domain-containing protein YqiC